MSEQRRCSWQLTFADPSAQIDEAWFRTWTPAVVSQLIANAKGWELGDLYREHTVSGELTVRTAGGWSRTEGAHVTVSDGTVQVACSATPSTGTADTDAAQIRVTLTVPTGRGHTRERRAHREAFTEALTAIAHGQATAEYDALGRRNEIRRYAADRRPPRPGQPSLSWALTLTSDQAEQLDGVTFVRLGAGRRPNEVVIAAPFTPEKAKPSDWRRWYEALLAIVGPHDLEHADANGSFT